MSCSTTIASSSSSSSSDATTTSTQTTDIEDFSSNLIDDDVPMASLNISKTELLKINNNNNNNKELLEEEEEEEEGKDLLDRSKQQRQQKPKQLIKDQKEKEDIESDRQLVSELSTLQGGVPGSHSIFVKTWGCSHNWSDSEYMAGILAKQGYRVTMKEEESLNTDIWILNSCTVKGRAQNLFESALKKARSLNKYIITAGCVPQGDRKNKLWADVSAIGVQQIDQIVYAVEQTLKGNVVQIWNTRKEEVKKKEKKDNEGNDDGDGDKERKGGHSHSDELEPTTILSKSQLQKLYNQQSKSTYYRKAGGAPLSMPKMRRHELEEIIPINTGCLNQCTYCKTKHARGDLGSYSIEEITDRIKEVVKEGIQIINLESEDTGAYGLDIGTNIAELLEAIVVILDDVSLCRNVMLRLGISNPPYFLEHAERVAQVLKHPRIFTYLHIPVQSGSNQILYDMKRKYNIEDFNTLCEIMTTQLPDIHLCTDIIAGFPTETAEDWHKTMQLVRQWKFPTVFISPFFPRPGTPAAQMDYVFGKDKSEIDQVKKERVAEMTRLCKSFRCYDRRLNTRQFWICTNDVTKDGIHFVGLNKFAEKICIKCPKFDEELLSQLKKINKKYEYDIPDITLKGKILEVTVFDCGQKYMYGKICEEYIPLLFEYPEEKNYIELYRELLNSPTSTKTSHNQQYGIVFKIFLALIGVIAAICAYVLLA